MRDLVEDAGVARLRGGGVERVEGGNEALAPGREARRDGALFRRREQTPPPQQPGHPHPPRGVLQLRVDRRADSLSRPPHGALPRPEPRAPAHGVEHALALLAHRGRARLAPELQHARRQLLAHVVEGHPRRLEPPWDEQAAERRRELRNAERHRDLERGGRGAHRASRAARPVRAS
ncbi:MAG: hypothetical protein DMD65_01065 [Gemmatimonadetes bacterium]|nr:MAG: hypothetical protein DMD65_01065 [Gemmatimonadota bacterium]